ncbi:hypothetical protein [Brucella thiophenivorans]|uniref:Uncharacterized protein n=1 Tax=Brucella thiophenivorans TaxID=571255 RepID=A0A256FA02_9HYPH|nr:hypothetical protein [Brucella thiophenivorans]OYR11697.1 hypothetical protein CEV31_3692 [Brucella thiophenivorans]
MTATDLPFIAQDAIRARARTTILWANLSMIAMVVIHDVDHVRC